MVITEHCKFKLYLSIKLKTLFLLFAINYFTLFLSSIFEKNNSWIINNINLNRIIYTFFLRSVLKHKIFQCCRLNKKKCISKHEETSEFEKFMPLSTIQLTTEPRWTHIWIEYIRQSSREAYTFKIYDFKISEYSAASNTRERGVSDWCRRWWLKPAEVKSRWHYSSFYLLRSTSLTFSLVKRERKRESIPCNGSLCENDPISAVTVTSDTKKLVCKKKNSFHDHVNPLSAHYLIREIIPHSFRNRTEEFSLGVSSQLFSFNRIHAEARFNSSFRKPLVSR